MRLSQVVVTSLNGDIEEVDPAVRRTLVAIASEIDEQADGWELLIHSLDTKIDTAVDAFKDEVKSVRRLLVGLTSTVIGGVIVGILNVIVNVNL